MIIKEYCLTMAHYNAWMNQKLYQLCEKLTPDQLKENRGAFFKSVLGTLNHLLYGDRVWLGRFLGQQLTNATVNTLLYEDFSLLKEERELTDKAILGWAEALTEDFLQAPFSFTSKIDGVTRTFKSWVLVTHMFNHQTHHRGQLTTLLSQLGIEPGVTDLPAMPNLRELTDE